MLCLFTDSSIYEYDLNTIHIETLNYYTADELKEKNVRNELNRTQADVEFDLKFPFPFNYRKLKTGVSMTYYEKEKTLIHIAKPFKYKDENWSTPKMQNFKSKNKHEEKHKAYQTFLFYGMILKEIDENKCSYSQIFTGNLGGWLSNPKLKKMIAKDRGYFLRDAFVKVGKNFPDNVKISDCKDLLCCLDEQGKISNGYGRLLYDCMVNSRKDN
jgi:hypothetical protein